jgi:hypothetical protein
MAWRKYPVEKMRVSVRDDILGETVVVERMMEFFEGYHSGGRISYRGERLAIIFAPGPYLSPYYSAESYPPARRRCRTKRAREWWANREGK